MLRFQANQVNKKEVIYSTINVLVTTKTFVNIQSLDGGKSVKKKGVLTSKNMIFKIVILNGKKFQSLFGGGASLIFW